jgi:hypothetical protein
MLPAKTAKLEYPASKHLLGAAMSIRNKIILLLVLFIAVCGHAKEPLFDNESSDNDYDNDDDGTIKEDIEKRKKIYEYISERNKEISEKMRFGIRLGSGVLLFDKNVGFQIELGGIANIPLSKSFLLDVELNYIKRMTKSYYEWQGEEALSIPLLFRYVFYLYDVKNLDAKTLKPIENANIFLPYPMLEAGIVIDYLKETNFIGLALGLNFRLTTHLECGTRIIYYTGLDAYPVSLTLGYLF